MEITPQTELLTRFRRLQRDSPKRRWDDREYYEAINACLRLWGQKVLAPYHYTITDGWESATREYTLPYYVREPLQPQYRLSQDQTWETLVSFDLNPVDTGGLLLTLTHFPPTADGRIEWWAGNSVVPALLPAVSTAIDADDTTLTIDSTEPIVVSEAGYIRIGSEWMQYAGRVASAYTATLPNLVRGCFGTTAATHAENASVEWGVVAHRSDLWECMSYAVKFYLHGLLLTRGTPTERETHEFVVRYNKQLYDEYWRGYSHARTTKLRLTRRALGPGSGRRPYRYQESDTW